MSDQRLSSLHEQVAPAVHQPEIEVLERRARSRRHRHRVGAALAAVAVVAGGWQLAGYLVPGPEGTTPADRQGSELYPSLVLSAPATAEPGATVQVSFADASNGFALTAPCPATPTPCRPNFWATTDGGRTWARRALPPGAGINTSSGVVYAVGPTSVFVGGEAVSSEAGANPNGGEVSAETLVFSRDAGRTWQAVPPVTASVPSIPAGGYLEARCDRGYDRCEVVTTDPATGVRAGLRTQPPLNPSVASGVWVGTDGGRWVSGQAPDGAPAIAITRDDGRTWALSTFPRLGSPIGGPRVVTRDGRELYALMAIEHRDVKNGLGPIYHSTDGGKRWALVPAERGRPTSMTGGVLLPDGRLLLGTEGGEQPGPVVISVDGGRTFSPVPALGLLAWFSEVDGRYLAMDDERHPFTSDDGVHWEPLRIPAS
ncbi:MAG TPA: sialidase family protein [Cryptosporangiaceae bacterium]|nr:sialidase family protein [Cryptosporangiaceae bacterium]